MERNNGSMRNRQNRDLSFKELELKIVQTQSTDIKIIPIVSADTIGRSKRYLKIDQSIFRPPLLKT